MPEAVASNSTCMPIGQPKYGWKQHFSEGFEEVDAMLFAFREMNTALYQTKQDHSEASWGIYLIQGLIMERLKSVTDQVGTYLEIVEPMELTGLERGIDIAVMMRIVDIRSQALLDAGMITDLDGPWPEGVGEENHFKAAEHYNELVAKARKEGAIDLLTIGSYLPWLELRIRRELGLDQAPADDLTSVSTREKIERAVDRLTGTGG